MDLENGRPRGIYGVGTHRLRSRTRRRVHLLRLAQQFIAKLACGATKTSREDLVRPSNLAVVDFAPWCTIWDKSRSLTKPDNGDGFPLVSLFACFIDSMTKRGVFSFKKDYLYAGVDRRAYRPNE